jgi:inorganic pyrophosphatase
MTCQERYIFDPQSNPHRVARIMRFSLCLFAVISLLSCKNNKHPYAKFEPPAMESAEDSSAIYAVVEIPAGTATLQHLDTLSGTVVPLADGAIDFLAAPGNIGFVSSTQISGGKPLEVIVLMHALAEESVVQILPIGVLQLQENGQMRQLVVSVPADADLQSIRVGRFVDFITEYEAARYILQEWFINYKGFGALSLVGWQDERFALQLIEANRIQAR